RRLRRLGAGEAVPRAAACRVAAAGDRPAPGAGGRPLVVAYGPPGEAGVSAGGRGQRHFSRAGRCGEVVGHRGRAPGPDRGVRDDDLLLVPPGRTPPAAPPPGRPAGAAARTPAAVVHGVRDPGRGLLVRLLCGRVLADGPSGAGALGPGAV